MTLARDEELVRSAVEECEESLRFALPEDVREEVEAEGRLLAALLARIEERRALGAAPPRDRGCRQSPFRRGWR
jgi:hypothetical protein